jgi:hypothetical protein
MLSAKGRLTKFVSAACVSCCSAACRRVASRKAVSEEGLSRAQGREKSAGSVHDADCGVLTGTQRVGKDGIDVWRAFHGCDLDPVAKCLADGKRGLFEGQEKGRMAELSKELPFAAKVCE